MSRYSSGPDRTLQIHDALGPNTGYPELRLIRGGRTGTRKARTPAFCTTPPLSTTSRLHWSLDLFVVVIRGSEFYVLVQFQMTALSVEVIKEGCLPPRSDGAANPAN